MAARAGCVCRTMIHVPTMPATPSGTLMRKALRQPYASTSRPPSAGPTAAAVDTIPPHRLMARARSRGSSKVARRIASELGTNSAAPTPCSTRAATSATTEGASPHPAEAATNTASPARNTVRAPMRSLNSPPVRIRAAKLSV
jgi:hypothetical protein